MSNDFFRRSPAVKPRPVRIIAATGLLHIISPFPRILQCERLSSRRARERERDTFMTTEIKLRLNEELDKLTIAAHENPVVARCTRAWVLFYCEATMKGQSDDSARAKARQGYRLAMPPLTGSRNVRDFIACTTHGLLLGALDVNEATRLLYAAQVAHTARLTKARIKKTVKRPVSPANEPLSKQPRIRKSLQKQVLAAGIRWTLNPDRSKSDDFARPRQSGDGLDLPVTAFPQIVYMQ